MQRLSPLPYSAGPHSQEHDDAEARLRSGRFRRLRSTEIGDGQDARLSDVVGCFHPESETLAGEDNVEIKHGIDGKQLRKRRKLAVHQESGIIEQLVGIRIEAQG